MRRRRSNGSTSTPAATPKATRRANRWSAPASNTRSARSRWLRLAQSGRSRRTSGRTSRSGIKWRRLSGPSPTNCGSAGMWSSARIPEPAPRIRPYSSSFVCCTRRRSVTALPGSKVQQPAAAEVVGRSARRLWLGCRRTGASTVRVGIMGVGVSDEDWAPDRELVSWAVMSHSVGGNTRWITF